MYMYMNIHDEIHNTIFSSWHKNDHCVTQWRHKVRAATGARTRWLTHSLGGKVVCIEHALVCCRLSRHGVTAASEAALNNIKHIRMPSISLQAKGDMETHATKSFLIIQEWGCSSVVERSLCMWKASCYIPGISTMIHFGSLKLFYGLHERVQYYSGIFTCN